MAINTLGAPRRSPTPQRRRDFQRQPYQRYHRPLPRSPGTWRPSALPSPMNVAKRKVAEKVAGKLLARAVPFLGWALLAYDIYDWLKSNGLRPQGALHNRNPTGPLDGGFYTLGPASSSSTHNPALPNGQNWVGAPSSTQTTTALNTYVRQMNRNLSLPAPFVWQESCWGPYAAGTVVRRGAFAIPKPAIRPAYPLEPYYEPWFDPSLPPQFQPQAKPDPRWQPKRRPIAPGIDWRYYEGPYVVPSRPFDPTKPIQQPPRPRRKRKTKPRWPWPYMDPLPRPTFPVPQPIEDPVPWPMPGPRPAPVPGAPPGPGMMTPIPGYITIIDPRVGPRPKPRLRPLPRPRPREPGPYPTPPRSGDIERKVGMSALGYGWVMSLFNFTTEARDWIDAVYKALPCNVRSKSHNTAVKKMEAIYRHFDAIDPEAMVTELFLNQIEDAVIGKTSGFINKAFGSSASWANYYRAFQAGNELIPGVGKVTNEALDNFAKSAGLKRVRCGRGG